MRVSFVAAVVALILVPVLAVLQYRWIGDISRAERERMRVNVERSAMRFAGEFNGELNRIAQALLPGGPQVPLTELAAFSKLIEDIYRLEPGGVVRRFNRETRALEPARLPEYLSPNPRPESVAVYPVLIVPHGGQRPPMAQPGPPMGGPPQRADVTIVVLNMGYFTTELFPELAKKHLGDEYAFEIHSRGPLGKLIYRSHEGVDASQNPEASVGIFEARFDPMRPGPPPQPGRNFRWQLFVKHRSESLDAMVAKFRNRNLIVSSAVLGLMAAAILLIAHSNRRAEQLARQQMEFVAGVSHELRTPVAVIRSAADNLADGLITNEQQARRYGGVIRSESQRLTGMVEQILRFAGIQSGHAKYELRPTDIITVVTKALTVMDETLHNAGMIVETEFVTNPPLVMADADALLQCLTNLIGNAAKYARQGHWVGVTVRCCEAGALTINIDDHGPGIPKNDARQIFQPFYRGRLARESQLPGAGLGLSIVKRILEGHNGTIDYEPLAKGSRFRITLPTVPNKNETTNSAD